MLQKVHEVFGLKSPYNHSQLCGHSYNEPPYMGVECEVEAVANFKDDWKTAKAWWAVTDDGSLRNCGKEFILCPTLATDVPFAFERLHSAIGFIPGDDPFTERTSIHVHVNCMNLTLEQTRSIFLWYAALEPYFFQMVKPERLENIHCVPLSDTLLSNFYSRSLTDMLEGHWGKYSAFNLLPLRTQGTIELRHMHGHNDSHLFQQWIKVISNLWLFGAQTTLTGNYTTPHMMELAYDRIFSEARATGLVGPFRLSIIENSLLDVKKAFI